jgi:GDP-L-fucose synthase
MIGKKSRRGIPYAGKVLVSGDTGFLAHHILPILEDRWEFADIIRSQGSKFFDLTRLNHVSTMLNSIEANHGPIRTIIHLAGMSGGIKDNMERQATYFYQNLMMGINMIEACSAPNRVVEKLIMFMGGCSFPNKEGKTTPFKEEEMWDGLPVDTSLGYSFAKKTLLIAADVYKRQFGFKTSLLLPTNLIGEWDNFDENQSHVAAGLIQRFVEAREEGYDSVTVWGSGKPVRDFIYAGDVAELLPDIINNYGEVGPLNISTGVGTSIAELAEMILKATKFKGKLIFDTTKPDGQMHKTLDNSKLLSVLGTDEINFTPLDEAIGRTVDWFESRVWKK